MFKSMILTSAIASTSALFYTNDLASQKFMWAQYKQEYNKKYDALEEGRRFNTFLNNLRTVDERNTRDANKVHGITKFTDLTQEEYTESMLGSKIDMKQKGVRENTVTEVPPALTATKDWAGVLTTPVKDQGYCGSCWAFSATEQVESDAIRMGLGTFVLSASQTTQCTGKPSAGCGGGWTESAYKYIASVPGLETNADYPYSTATYQGVTGTCTAVASKEVIGMTTFTTIGGASASAVETNMANYVLATGPLSVCLDAQLWNSYTGGIMTTCGQNVDHCVQAVGVNTATTSGYWKVRNSWGTTWGEQGYIRLAYGANTCDITNDPTWVNAKKV